MPTLENTEVIEHGSWWEGRRKVFSLVVAAGYGAAILVYELSTPQWAGDHIGLSAPSLLLYALGGLIWVGFANIFFSLGRLLEKLLKPRNVSTYRRRVYAGLLIAGAASTGAWFGLAVFLAWLRPR